MTREPEESPGIGDNSGDEPEGPTVSVGGVAADRLRLFIERIERLEEERQGIGGDIREAFAEAKALGFDTKIMRIIIKLRKQDAAARQEEEALLETYKHALGME